MVVIVVFHPKHCCHDPDHSGYEGEVNKKKHMIENCPKIPPSFHRTWEIDCLLLAKNIFVFPITKQYGMFSVNRVKLTERSKALDLSSATHSVCSNSTLCNLILLIPCIDDWQDIRTHSNNVWTLLIVV